MSFLKFGVIARSGKENERRLPLHPDHFHQILPQLRRAMFFERGYGEPFGVSDEALTELFGGLADRDELLRDCDIVLLPKPLPGDLRAMREGGILWGWPHCVQQPEITQIAINRKQTLLAWEAMFTWKRGGTPELHLFHRNNEMAGYCGV
ncbi:alanine dehydrogenase, partial [Candidatus Bipolaricaulota bacterium]|nr:alanine dehydrogenase [Candidatus Bipolaricaulota bacterium]